MTGDTFYRKWRIIHNPKPIPSRAFDWDFYHTDYDGPGDSRAGAAESVGGCIREIKEIEADEASYENQAQPVNPWRPVSELPHALTGKKVGQ